MRTALVILMLAFFAFVAADWDSVRGPFAPRWNRPRRWRYMTPGKWLLYGLLAPLLLAVSARASDLAVPLRFLHWLVRLPLPRGHADRIRRRGRLRLRRSPPRG